MKKLMIILFGMLFLISFISATTDISENLMNTTGNVTALYYCNSTNSCHTITDLLTDTDTTYTAGSNLTLTNTTFTLNTISVTEWLNSVYLAIGDAFSGAYADLTGKPTVLSNFTDDLGNRGYTSNLNFTNDAGYTTNTGTVTSVATDDTYLTGGAITTTGTITFSTTLAGTSLSVNSSDYWDNLGSPSDINAADITDDGTYRLQSWNNLTGIPHATPSNGDTTHFSLADEIYDWVIGLSYATTSYADSLGNFSAWDKDYNDLINKPTFTNDTWVDTYFPRFTEIVGLVGNWTADKPNYSNTTQMNTAIETANTSMKGYVDNQGFLTSETDLLAYNGTLALNSSLSNYYLISNPFSFYNSTTIPSYILTTNEGNLNVNSSNYWNNYNTPSGFLWTAGFNATGDTRWLTSYTEADPLWTDNSTLVGYLASNNQWTANQNLTNKNMTDVSCIKFTNGASWCGV